MAKETVVIYAEISEYEICGWVYRIASLDCWQTLAVDGPRRKKIAEIKVDKPSKEWIAKAGIEFVASEIQQAKDELVHKIQRMREFESKFLLLDMD